MSLKDELHLRRPFSSLQEEALLSVFTTYDLLYRNVQKAMRRHGLSLAQYNVLRILRGAGAEGTPLMAIARKMIVRYPNVTRLTDRLENEGLIRRERSTTDRRVVYAFVTPRALDILSRLDGEVEQLDIKLMRGADDGKLRDLISLLAEVRAPLRDGDGMIATYENGSGGVNGSDPDAGDENGSALTNGDDPDEDI
jgi:MarR family transcriptional regulator, organic hydroperoxide resistance regulator